MELLGLIVAAALTFHLAHRLCGDPYAASLAGILFVFSPIVRLLAAKDARLAACMALLPLLFILFYRTGDIPHDEPGYARKLHLGALALCLAFMGVFDPRFAVVANLLVWMVLLLGYAMDRRRRSEMWGPPFLGWTIATVASLALYLPLWWWRRLHPGAVGGALTAFPLTGTDFMDLWRPSAFYVGMSAFVIAIAALQLARSYRNQARLWFMLGGFMFWLSVGPRFILQGRYLWWVPALYRGARKIPLLADVDPSFFAAAGQFALAILAAYGFGALMTRVHPTKLRWLRPIMTAVLAFLLIGDFLRVQPFLP